MVIQKGITKQLLGSFILLALMAGCNEQEFYEKSFLQGAGVDRPDETSPIDNEEFGDPIVDIEPEIIPDPVVNVPPDADETTDIADNNDNGSNNNSDETDTEGNTDVVDNTDDNVVEPTDDTNVVDNSDDSTDSTDIPDVVGNTDDTTNENEGTTDSGENTDIAEDNEDQTDPTPADAFLDVVDQFTQAQEERSKVDILWVIDDSGSMGDEQAALAYNFDAFINNFLNENVDFKMGITTTDASSRGDGKWAINYKHLTREQANKNEDKFLRDFKRSVQVGTRGSAKEMGLKTAQRFLERYNKRIPDPFLRDDAYLIIVVLSDEEDQSPKTVASYVDFYKAQKTNASMVKLYSIVAMKKTPNRWETVGDRYMQASDETNGVKHHIKDNFYHILRAMGSQIVELTRSFALSQIPYEGKLVVKVNGQVADGWSYQDETRSISFAEDKTPAAGSSISVEYQKLIGSH